MQKDARDQWVKEPKYPTWGFENPLPHLVKVKIDGRPSMPATQFPLPDRPGGLAKRSGNLVFPSSSQLPPFGEGFPPPFPVSRSDKHSVDFINTLIDKAEKGEPKTGLELRKRLHSLCGRFLEPSERVLRRADFRQVCFTVEEYPLCKRE